MTTDHDTKGLYLFWESATIKLKVRRIFSNLFGKIRAHSSLAWAVFAVLAVSILGVSFANSNKASAEDPPVSTVTRWLNRYMITDDEGKTVYKDTNTFDTRLEFTKVNDTDCPDKPDKIYFKSKHWVTNHDFYYNNSTYDSDYEAHFQMSSKRTDTRGTYCEYDSDNTGTVMYKDYRRMTFYKADGDKIVSIFNNIEFSRYGSYKGNDRYLRASELGRNPAYPCPDMLILHKAHATHDFDIFPTGDIPGSAILFAVLDRSKNGDGKESESYSIDGEFSNTTCWTNPYEIVENNEMGKTQSDFGLSAAMDKTYDFIKSAGLDRNGNTAAEDDKMKDDAYTVFIGTRAENMPKDLGAPPGNPGGGKIDIQKCRGGMLGYIICPVISLIENVAAGIEAVMSEMLAVNPLQAPGPGQSEASSNIYKSWDNMRNLANVAFVLAFFAVIFSQATSIGISSYGIKKLLPRLVMVVIACNLSFYICAFAIDIFNILGVGVATLFAVIGGNGSAGTVEVGNGTAGVIIGLFSIGIIGTVAAWGTIAVELIPFLIMFLLAILATFLVLIARQIIMILLVIISPIAIVASLLPGTKGWFKKWYDTYLALLVMYPMVIALFAGSRLASAVVSAGTPDTFLGTLISTGGILIQVFVGFAMLFMFKWSFMARAGLGKIGNSLGNARNKLTQQYRESGSYQARKQANQMRKAEKFYEMAGATGRGIKGLRGRAFRTYNRMMMPGATKDLSEHIESEALKREEARIQTGKDELVRETDAHTAGLLGIMRKGETVDDFIERIKKEALEGDETSKLVQKYLTEQQVRNLKALFPKFANRIGDSAFATSALYAIHQGTGSADLVHAATENVAYSLKNNDHKTIQQVNARLMDKIAPAQIGAGYGPNDKYAGYYETTDANGQTEVKFSKFGQKLPEAVDDIENPITGEVLRAGTMEAAALLALHNTDLNHIEGGQLFSGSGRTVNDLSDTGRALLFRMQQDPTIANDDLAQAIKSNKKAGAKTELTQISRLMGEEFATKVSRRVEGLTTEATTATPAPASSPTTAPAPTPTRAAPGTTTPSGIYFPTPGELNSLAPTPAQQPTPLPTPAAPNPTPRPNDTVPWTPLVRPRTAPGAAPAPVTWTPELQAEYERVIREQGLDERNYRGLAGRTQWANARRAAEIEAQKRLRERNNPQ
jgi:hypothetical protein